MKLPNNKGVLNMRKTIIDFINNNMKMNQEEIYCDITKFLIKHHGIKIIGKNTINIVFSVWQIGDVLLYIELHGADFNYTFLN